MNETPPIPAIHLAALLAGVMRACRSEGISFTACMAEARKQFNQEVHEQAMTKEMPT